MAHKWARWLHHPCRLGGGGGGGGASERGDRIRIGPQVGKVATSPLPPRGFPPLPSGGTESELAHKWARWLHHPCRPGGGGGQCFRAGGQNPKWPTSGQGGYITLAARGGPHRFRAGGQHQNWPTSGQGGYITPAASGVPTALERGDRIRSGPQVGKVATSALPPGGGGGRFRAGGQNQKWPTSGQGGYITPAALGFPTASERGDTIKIAPQVGKVATSPLPPGGSPPLPSGGTASELAHKWARWLHHPCRLGGGGGAMLQSGGT